MVERAGTFDLPASVGRLGGQIMVPHAWRFARRLRAFRPDALLLSTFKKVWLGGMAARMAGVPRVVSRIGLDSDLPRRSWMYRVAYRRWIDAVLVNADGIRRPFLADLPGYDPDRVATVYDGVRLEAGGPTHSTRAEVRAQLAIPEDARVVGTITRLSVQKRIDRLLDAMALVPEAHLVVAGEGELETDMHQHASDLGIHDRVHFLGFRSDVARVLSAFDVFALTSDKEGMANAMLESLAMGVPVVSTDVSGAREALGPDSQGRAAGLVVDSTPQSVARGLDQVLASEARRAAMAEEALRRAGGRFDFGRMVDAWEAVLGGESPAAVHQGA
jgi:glycosyltransferase involved in cell wall biosynthesis